ncbi:MAG: OmpA family protein [Myxococcota bacterium]
MYVLRPRSNSEVRWGYVFFAALLATLHLGEPLASAQFDDEFDDEFDEPSEPAQPAEPAPEPAAEPEGDDFGDGFDDDFGDSSDASDSGDTDSSETADSTDASDDETPPSFAADEDGDEDEGPEGDEERRARLFRAQNTYMGAVGGLHVVDAGSGAEGSFRVQLMTDFFVTSDFIQPGDDADHVGGSLSINATVHDYIEIWGSIQSYANSNSTGDPSLFQVLGDAQIGIKAFYPINNFLTVGGDLTLNLLNTVGDIGLVAASTGFGIRGNFTADFRGLPSRIPLIGRFNIQYRLDNSEKLVEDTEDARYNNLPDANPDRSLEFRQFITPVERFALNINRSDFVTLALGFEAPLRVTEDFYIQPLIEWVWDLPVNRQGFDCLQLFPEGAPDGVDSCQADEGISANPMNLTLGVRVLPPVKGLSFLAAADIGLTGTSTLVRELAPTAPYNIYLGVAYAYDTRPAPALEPEIREVERRVEVPGELPLMGRIRGTIVEQGAGTPIEGASITYEGQDRSPQLTDATGTFTSYAFEPAAITMTLRHPEYNDGQCAATIPDQRPEEGELFVDVRCELVALPRVGLIAGSVNNADGGAVAGATVQLSGAATRSVTTGSDGSFSATDLPPGQYQVRVEADDFLIRTDTVTVAARETASPTLTLIPRPSRALVRVRSRDIQIRRSINFATNSSEILPSSEPLMTEIADVLLRNPDIRRIEIQGHTDNRGRSNANMTLSQNRADAVRTWLINHGVDASRMESRGYGDTNPLVPNITPSNRARNRRVQFIIRERADQ